MDGKVFAITGSAGGIGLAVAVELASRGAAVSLADIKASELEKAQQDIQQKFSSGAKVLITIVDVTKRDQVDVWISKTVEVFGRLDGCVNSAGVMGTIADIPNVSEETLNQVIDINLKGTFNSLRAQLPKIVDGGSIVNIASMSGLTAVPYFSPYCLSKHAVIGLTKTAAKENAERRIRVNAVCPGMTESPMLTAFLETAGAAVTPEQVAGRQLFKRAAKPEEIAAMVVFLLGEDSKFITGVAHPVSGGWDI